MIFDDVIMNMLGCEVRAICQVWKQAKQTVLNIEERSPKNIAFQSSVLNPVSMIFQFQCDLVGSFGPGTSADGFVTQRW